MSNLNEAHLSSEIFKLSIYERIRKYEHLVSMSCACEYMCVCLRVCECLYVCVCVCLFVCLFFTCRAVIIRKEIDMPIKLQNEINTEEIPVLVFYK